MFLFLRQHLILNCKTILFSLAFNVAHFFPFSVLYRKKTRNFAFASFIRPLAKLLREPADKNSQVVTELYNRNHFSCMFDFEMDNSNDREMDNVVDDGNIFRKISSDSTVNLKFTDIICEVKDQCKNKYIYIYYQKYFINAVYKIYKNLNISIELKLEFEKILNIQKESVIK